MSLFLRGARGGRLCLFRALWCCFVASLAISRETDWQVVFFFLLAFSVPLVSYEDWINVSWATDLSVAGLLRKSSDPS